MCCGRFMPVQCDNDHVAPASHRRPELAQAVSDRIEQLATGRALRGQSHQITRSPLYFLNSRSMATMAMSSASAVAISIRSNGSE
jgi:hypothetical protein